MGATEGMPPQGVTVQQFFLGLVRSGLVAPDDLRGLRQQYPPATDADDAQNLARDLVARQWLSPYQASALYQRRDAELLVGPYRIIDRLRSSSVGMVFKAAHIAQGNLVELKIVADDSPSPDSELRFQRDAQLVASLHHVHIPAVVDFGDADGRFYVATELVAGDDLRSLLKSKGPLNVTRAVTSIAQAARTLAYAQARGVMHGSLNPASIVIGTARQIKLLDLGLASFRDRGARLDDHADEDDRTGESGRESRSDDYRAPEQMLDGEPIDTRSDIYSLGCILHRIITGRRPYSGDSAAAKMQAHREHPVPSLRDRRREVPEAVDRVFQRMLAKCPEDRYQTMTELADDLERTLTSTDDALPPTTAPAIAAAPLETPAAPSPQPEPLPVYTMPTYTAPVNNVPVNNVPAYLQCPPSWPTQQPAAQPNACVDPWSGTSPEAPVLPMCGAASPSVAKRSERRGQRHLVRAFAFIFAWIIGGVLGVIAGYCVLLEMNGRDADYFEMWPYWQQYRQPIERSGGSDK